MSRLIGLLVLMLLVKALCFAQQVKPKYVMSRFISAEEKLEEDPFLKKLGAITSNGLNRTPEMEVYDPLFARKHPVQYFIKTIPSYLHYIWNGSYHYGYQDSKQEVVFFDYRMNYSPKVDLILGDISTGAILNTYRIQTRSVFEPEPIAVPYDQLGLKKGMVIEAAEQAKYFKMAEPFLLKEANSRYIFQAERIAWKEFNEVANYVQWHLFPQRKQLVSFKPSGKDQAVASIPDLDAYHFSPYHTFYVYLVKEYKDETGTFERIELLETLVTTGKDGTFLRYKPNGKIEEALQKGETVWCSPLTLHYTSTLKEASPTIAVNLRAPGLSIEPKTMAILSTRLNLDVFNVRGKYLTLLDRQDRQAIQWEKKENQTDSKIDEQYIAQFKSLGCRYILDAEIRTLRNKPYFNDYLFYADYILRLIDVESGEVISEVVNEYSKIWSHIKATDLIANLEYDIINAASSKVQEKFMKDLGLKYLEFNIREIINRSLPSKIKVNEVVEIKGKAKSVFISGNFNEKFIKDDYHVCIQKEVEVDGKMETRWEQIGRIAITSAVGDGLALAKVKKGEEEIYAAFQKGEKLYCFDRPEWLIDGNYKWQLKKAGF
jgi:hypothetical protein